MAVTATSLPVIAQDSDDDRGIEEVVVTVERRSTSLQDYAGTAISFSGDELDMGGIINITDLAENVPGLEIGNSGGNYVNVFQHNKVTL